RDQRTCVGRQPRSVLEPDRRLCESIATQDRRWRESRAHLHPTRRRVHALGAGGGSVAGGFLTRRSRVISYALAAVAPCTTHALVHPGAGAAARGVCRRVVPRARPRADAPV